MLVSCFVQYHNHERFLSIIKNTCNMFCTQQALYVVNLGLKKITIDVSLPVQAEKEGPGALSMDFVVVLTKEKELKKVIKVNKVKGIKN